MFNVQFDSIKQEYVQKLENLRLDAILGGGDVEEACKKIGQEIFENYNKEALKETCEALSKNPKNGLIRKQYVEAAWQNFFNIQSFDKIQNT